MASGDALMSPAATRSLITRFLATPEPGADTALSRERGRPSPARWREVMALATAARSNTEITAGLFLSPLTVRTHIQRAKTKRGARTAPNWSSSPTGPASCGPHTDGAPSQHPARAGPLTRASCCIGRDSQAQQTPKGGGAKKPAPPP